ncbi:hypothetical protein K7X08_002320 [Anisodus acutangulus]|uniref:Uncharacterized protein n=1 Tax=Anisodus acutangulus TaxID=402998 RepID=A0A9Q1R417_9SOLA|nr:hypothetical protein K7X08_002320 [Anisodus acutangulus]
MMELKAKYIASGTRIYRVLIPMENSLLNLGKEDLLIPEQCELSTGSGCSILGNVDSYGHLIVSRLDASGKDVNRLTYSVSPQECGVGEGSWAGLCFNPIQWSMVFDLMSSSLESVIINVDASHLQLLPIHFTFGGEPLYCARGCKIEAFGVEERPYPCHLTNLRSISCCVFALVLQYSLCPLPEIFPDRLVCLFQPSALREVPFVVVYWRNLK